MKFLHVLHLSCTHIDIECLACTVAVLQPQGQTPPNTCMAPRSLLQLCLTSEGEALVIVAKSRVPPWNE